MLCYVKLAVKLHYHTYAMRAYFSHFLYVYCMVLQQNFFFWPLADYLIAFQSNEPIGIQTGRNRPDLVFYSV